MILAATHVVVDDRTVLSPGWVRTQGATIVEVGVGDVPGLDNEARTFPQAVITPGLINVHTHLELSNLGGKVPPGRDFCDWLARVMRVVGTGVDTLEGVTAAVANGVQHSLRAGVTCVGDIARHPQLTRGLLQRSALSGISFGEVIAIGNRRGQVAAKIAAAMADNEGSGGNESKGVWRWGISPHAPYTVEPDGLAACARVANERGARVCVHLLETPDEVAFTQWGTGPLADHLRRVQVWDECTPVAGVDPVTLLDETGLLGARTLLAHVNYVSDEQIERIAARAAHVAYCPRTHAAFAHSPHRFRDMLRAGVNVCVGTDSLASNPSLSVMDELRFLRSRHPDVAPGTLLSLATTRAARGLGLDDVVGSIGVGKRADLVVWPLASGQTGWDSILTTTGQGDVGSLPVAVLTSGVWFSQ